VLAGFDALDRQGQMVEVARGLRLVQGLVGAPGAPVVAQVEAARAAAVARAASADPAVMTPPAPRGGGAPTPPRAAPPTTAGPATSSTSRSRPAGPSTAPLLTPDDPLAQPTTSIKGIGPALGAALAARGLNTVEDLLWLVPRRWLDAREVAPIVEALGAAVDGERVGLRAAVVAARTVRARGRAWGEVRSATASCRALLVVRFFGVWAGIDRRFPVGAEPRCRGRSSSGRGRWQP
jgi:hypothetical protein